MLMIDARTQAPMTEAEMLSASRFGICPHLCGIEGVCTVKGNRDCSQPQNISHLWQVAAAFIGGGDYVMTHVDPSVLLNA